MKRRTFVATLVSGIAMTGMAGCTEESSDDSASGGNGGGSDGNDGGSNENDGDGSADTNTPEQTDSPTPESTDTNTPEQTDSPTPEADEPDVTILEDELFETDLGYAEVRGTVKNTSGEEQSYIGVEVKFFDAEDTRVGESMWNASDVADGREVEFETAMSTTEYGKVDSYEIEAATTPF